jgi:D-alanyl-D-alanine carboxypeptidase (penicillin-binding protein 5/6)
MRTPRYQLAIGLTSDRSFARGVACLLAIAILCGSCGSSFGQSSLEKKLGALIEPHAGTVSVAVKHLVTGETACHNDDRPSPTASLIKLPLMVSAYAKIERGELSLDQVLTLSEKDKVPGSGILTENFSEGTRFSLRDAIHLMIAFSDNTATNLVVDAVGLAQVSDDMAALGCPETKLHSKVFRRDTSIFPERSRQFGLGSTTAREMVSLLEKLHAGQLVGPTASKQMFQHLLACHDRNKLARHLPAGIEFAHKTGEVVDCKTDAGLIMAPSGPIAICVLTHQNADHNWGDDNEANVLCAEIGKVVYRHFHPDEETPSPSGVLKIGSQGDLVEDLQRTLNRALHPPPDLAVDGDFGPATQAAVLQFQKARGLSESGEVTDDVWQALGPLVTEDEPVPAPEVVNAEVMTRVEEEPQDGPPFVTARAWAILDGTSGELLAGLHADEPREMASTTKIMTAYVALQMVQEQPQLLQELVTFSRKADVTDGSTAGIREGEQLAVDELMYGLLLPSGNDASVAIAEHFGGKLPEGNGGDSISRHDRFIAAMNNMADKLGLRETEFRNPHGLPHPEHVASARDLGRLAWIALQDKNFQRYVNTRQRGCALVGPAGYCRHVVWKNTNQLLAINGYDGVKTGTTGAAGACLVARGQRNGQSRIIVVLGSGTSEARYVDIRNLFRWSWSLD